MMKKIHLKDIKDKKTNQFYEIIIDHLDFIFFEENIDLLKQHHLNLMAYKNGFTDKDKLFKNLRKAHVNFKDFNIDLLISYNKNKLFYLENKKLKRMDDLYRYAFEQSRLAFFLLLLNERLVENVDFIKNVAIFDILSFIILELSTKYPNEIFIPIQLIEDYSIEFSLEGKLMVNDNLLFMLDYLYKKIKASFDIIEINSNLLVEPLNIFLIKTSKSRLLALHDYLKTLYKK